MTLPPFGQLVGHVANAGYAFCDKAHQMDPMEGGEAVDFFGQQHTRLSVLAFNMGHDFEHYGNMVTYLDALESRMGKTALIFPCFHRARSHPGTRPCPLLRSGSSPAFSSSPS
ncbi:MAG: hypothetical protein Q8N53_06940 [Longimicrobiales bacterium]|nr:hypothetical protein [Longimicrobiales bacterium]